MQNEASSLSELLDSDDKDYRYDDGRLADKIDTAEFKQWLASLIKPEDIVEAAKFELVRREIEGDQVTIPCSNCRGRVRNSCPDCEERGQVRNTRASFCNEITGAERVLRLDLATLIVSNEVAVERDGYERIYLGDDQDGEQLLDFKVPDYIKKKE